MAFFQDISLSFWTIFSTGLLTIVAFLVIWGLQKEKRLPLTAKIFSENGALYMIRSLQFIVLLWWLFLTGSNIGFSFFDLVREPIIDTDNFRITPHTFLIILSELLLVLLIRQSILYLARLLQERRNIRSSQMRMLLTILDIFIWGAGLFLVLATMKLPVKTVFAFPLATFSDNNTLTVGNIISIILVFSLTNWVLSVLEEVFLNIGPRDRESRPRRKTMFTVFKYLIWVLIIILSLETVGVKISVLIASSAALFVGIGLGIQDIFKDLISGVFLHFEKNLKEGDIIESEGIVGEVKELGLRTTKIMTRDNIFMMVPNHQFITEPVINWSHSNQNTRFFVEVGVAYGSDVNLVEKILLECAAKNQKITNIPKPFVRFLNFGNSSLDFQLFFWTEDTFIVENIKSDIRFSVYKAFAENDIQIPFPQQDVYIKQFNDPKKTNQ